MKSGKNKKTSASSAPPAAIPGKGSCPRAPSSQQGFTLLEVVAALAILMLFLVPILGAVSQGLKIVTASRNRSLGLRLAQDKMTELEMMPVPDAEGVETGDFGEEFSAYRWEMEVIKTPDLMAMEDLLNVKGMEVHLRVLWEEAGTEKFIELYTLLLE